MQRNRAETTLPEITKKIQTLRTQFGQEVNKIEKSQTLGEDLAYKPKIWWFQHLEWIGDFMKTRTDSTPLGAKITKVPKVEISERIPLFEICEGDEIDDSVEHYTTEMEYSENEIDTETIEAEPEAKKQKTYQAPRSCRTLVRGLRQDPNTRTIEYTLINEDTNEAPTTLKAQPFTPNQEFIEFHEEEIDQKNLDKCKRRSKTFGKFASALLMEITDDSIFFDLQSKITTSIHEAVIKQKNIKKS